MKKIIFLCLLSSSAFAIDFDACNSASDLGLKKCIKEFSTSTKKIGEAPQSCSPTAAGTSKNCPPLSPSFSSDGADCSNFISGEDNSSYGPWGNTIVDYLNEKGPTSLFFSNSIPGMTDGIRVCPKWDKLSLDEKKYFWVWTMASIAHVESRCKAGVRNHNGTNGVAAGLYQIDERQAMRSWRGPNCGGKNILDAKSNIKCGLDIMEDLLAGKDGVYRTNGELWGQKSHSYWEHLRRKTGGDIGALVRQMPFCNKN
jgi:hypothetical protein